MEEGFMPGKGVTDGENEVAIDAPLLVFSKRPWPDLIQNVSTSSEVTASMANKAVPLAAIFEGWPRRNSTR